MAAPINQKYGPFPIGPVPITFDFLPKEAREKETDRFIRVNYCRGAIAPTREETLQAVQKAKEAAEKALKPQEPEKKAFVDVLLRAVAAKKQG